MDNTNLPTNEPKNQKIFVILGLVLVVAVIAVAIILNGQDKGEINETNIPSDAKPYIQDDGEAQVMDDDSKLESIMNEEDQIAITEIIKESVIMVDGADLIAKDGRVISPEGVEISTEASPNSVNSPRQTPAVAKDEVPASAIKLDISATGWSPNEFTVKAGAPITISVTSIDGFSHSIRFDDSLLSAVAIGVSPNETRAMTFNAPIAGEYSFRCDVPGHKNRGEVGLMIVQ